MSFLRPLRPKFQNHLVFTTLHNRIFFAFVFDKISKGMLEKELGEYFQRLHFWNQWVPLIKMHCRVRYLFDFDLKIRSDQVWHEQDGVGGCSKMPILIYVQGKKLPIWEGVKNLRLLKLPLSICMIWNHNLHWNLCASLRCTVNSNVTQQTVQGFVLFELKKI